MKHIRIIAPSSALQKYEDSYQKLMAAKTFLENAGFKVSYSDTIFANPEIAFYANIADIRCENMKNALLDPEIDIIWAFRGGSGAGEIAHMVHDIRPSSPKILIGFSDITAMHLVFNNIYHLPSIHGPVLTSLLDKDPESITQISNLLYGHALSIRLTPLNHKASLTQNINGKITGGNLAVICSLEGTLLNIITENRILLLEDVAEAGYKIARMFKQLKYAGKFNNIKACILGDFTDSDQFLANAIDDLLQDNPEIPFFQAANIGHGQINIPIVLGKDVNIDNNILVYSL